MPSPLPQSLPLLLSLPLLSLLPVLLLPWPLPSLPLISAAHRVGRVKVESETLGTLATNLTHKKSG
jgi:hypothetical protein